MPLRVMDLMERLSVLPPDAIILIPKPDTHCSEGSVDLADEIAWDETHKAVTISN